MTAPDRRASADDVLARVEVLRRILARRGAKRALLRTRRNFAWLTIGGDAHVVLSTDDAAAAIAIDAQSARVLAPVNEANRLAEEECSGLPLEMSEQPWNAAPSDRDGDGLTLGDEDLEQELAPARATLGGVEQTRMAWLGQRVTRVLEDLARGLEAGVTELEVSADIGRALAADGIRTPVLLVGADGRIARYRHPLPTSMPIRQRAMLVVVAERWGLHVAVTRTRELEQPTAELDRRRAATQMVLDAMLAATAPGRSLGAVFEAARQAYADVGFSGEWRLHHQGGLLGYRPRERLATPGDPTILAAGMAVAWNPSITGAKLESSHLLTESSGQLRALTDPEEIHMEPTRERSAS